MPPAKVRPSTLLMTAAAVPPPGSFQTATASRTTIAALRRCLLRSGPTAANDSRTESSAGAIMHRRDHPTPNEARERPDLSATRHRLNEARDTPHRARSGSRGSLRLDGVGG